MPGAAAAPSASPSRPRRPLARLFCVETLSALARRVGSLQPAIACQSCRALQSLSCLGPASVLHHPRMVTLHVLFFLSHAPCVGCMLPPCRCPSLRPLPVPIPPHTSSRHTATHCRRAHHDAQHALQPSIALYASQCTDARAACRRCHAPSSSGLAAPRRARSSQTAAPLHDGFGCCLRIATLSPALGRLAEALRRLPKPHPTG
jgi:hypothetical protein